MKRRVAFVAALVVAMTAAAAAVPLFAIAVRADAAAAPTRLDVRVEAPMKAGLPDQVVAHLTTVNGSAVNEVEVSVYLDVSFFGGRSALLGRAVTDSAGEARVALRPDKPRYKVRARFAGNDSYGPSEVVKDVAVPAGPTPSTTTAGDVELLAGVRHNAPRLIAALVALIWIALLAGGAWALRSIHHGAQARAQARP